MSRSLAAAALLIVACSKVGGAPSSSSTTGTGGVAGATTSSAAGGGAASSASSSSSSSSTGGGIDPGPVDHSALVAQVDTFCTAFADWYCNMALGCGCAAAPGWPGSVGSCRKLVLPSCNANVAQIEGAGAVFVPERAATCMAELQASGDASCMYSQLGLPSPWTACRRSIVYPPESLGGSCQYDGECALGTGYCVQQKCQPMVAVGKSCQFAACTADAFCDADKVCQPLGDAGAACQQDTECKLGLACNGENVCAAPIGPGLSCKYGGVCGSETVCKNGVCQPSPTACVTYANCGSASIMTCGNMSASTCQPLLPDGAGCGPWSGVGLCASGDCYQSFSGGVCGPVPGAGQFCGERLCQPGLGCDVQATYTCQPPAPLNAPCNVGPDAVQCGPGLICSSADGATGHCVVLPGSACQSDAECLPGERCSDARVCKKTVERGDPCSAGAPCEVGHECFHGRCRKVGAMGDACPQEFVICAPGLACVAGPMSGHGTCQALPTLDQPCDIDRRCADGLGCTGKPFAPGVCYPQICVSETYY